MNGRRLFLRAVAVLLTASLLVGCGGARENGRDSEVGPEYVTAYQAVELTKRAADRWQEKNWMIVVRDGDPDGINREGKSRIWEVYYFSPRPELNSQMMVIYNRGNVWPNAPVPNRGGDDGRETYRDKRPKDFRVDSPEAYNGARKNGGGDYIDAHPDARVEATLRCRADYDAVGEKMPGPGYQWIWDVAYREPSAGREILHIYIDGMNGDFISSETRTTR